MLSSLTCYISLPKRQIMRNASEKSWTEANSRQSFSLLTVDVLKSHMAHLLSREMPMQRSPNERYLFNGGAGCGFPSSSRLDLL